MKKFEGILICSDLDGTLFQENKHIAEKDLAAIAHFRKEGGIFTFITGRMPYFSAHVCELLQAQLPFGCINGGGVYDPIREEYIWRTSLPTEALGLVASVDAAFPGMGIQLNTFERIWFCRDNAATEWFRDVTGIAHCVCDYRGFEEPLAKIVFCDTDGLHIPQLEKHLRSHPLAENFDFIQSEKTLFEILPRGIHKGIALLKLAEHFGIDPARTVGVGDYNNDVPLLQAAGVGIAVGNATPAAKAAADRVTVRNTECAIARIIEDIENGTLPV